MDERDTTETGGFGITPGGRARLDKYGSTLDAHNVRSVCERIADYPEVVSAVAALLVAEVERCAEIGMTNYDALGQDQLEWFRAHPIGAAFGDVADIPDGRDAVVAWLRGHISSPPRSETP